jgi:hypothetical protein
MTFHNPNLFIPKSATTELYPAKLREVYLDVLKQKRLESTPARLKYNGWGN